MKKRLNRTVAIAVLIIVAFWLCTRLCAILANDDARDGTRATPASSPTPPSSR